MINEREFSKEKREELAKKGFAMKDGSYPIENVKDLKNAIQAFGRTGDDKKETKKHIIKRAKAMGKFDLLPENWKENLNEDDKVKIPTFDEFVKQQKDDEDEDEDDKPDAEDTGELTKDKDISTETPPKEPEETTKDDDKKDKDEKPADDKKDDVFDNQVISFADYLKLEEKIYLEFEKTLNEKYEIFDGDLNDKQIKGLVWEDEDIKGIIHLQDKTWVFEVEGQEEVKEIPDHIILSFLEENKYEIIDDFIKKNLK